VDGKSLLIFLPHLKPNCGIREREIPHPAYTQTLAFCLFPP